MPRTVQDFINKAGVAATRIERLPAPLPQQVGPLIAWAAFHLGGGFAAEAAIDQLQDAVGWKSLATLLNVDSFRFPGGDHLYTRSDEHRHGA